MISNLLFNFNELILKVWAYVLGVYAFLEANYNVYLAKYIPFPFKYVLIGVLAFFLFIIILSAIVKKAKKKKVIFYVNKKKYLVSKCKHKKDIIFPSEVKISGKKFVCWCTDKKLKKEFLQTKLLKNKKLKLYAKFEKAYECVDINRDGFASNAVKEVESIQEPIVTEVAPVEVKVEETVNVPEVESANEVVVNEEPIQEPIVTEVAPIQEIGVEEIKFDEPITEKVFDIGELYDAIRYEMLSYERAVPFKQLGVARKQIIAEMFEKNGKINLYFAIDPSLMREKGYNVSDYQEPEFKIVPCKKVIDSFADYEEVVNIIKETMLLNNFVKSDVVVASKTKSDENVRKSGFAFFVKNDVIATSSSEYYLYLRSIVLSYKMSAIKKHNDIDDKNMILKIFKKGEKVFLYLALNAEIEGLEFVGYDRNFMDTPAKFEINTAEDCFKAQALIDKLMYRYGMEKHPDQTEIDLTEKLESSCGFGYKIRR